MRSLCNDLLGALQRECKYPFGQSDTVGEFPAVNGGKAQGGTLDGGGPVVMNGMLYANPGYGRLIGQPGNALLAFSVEGH